MGPIYRKKMPFTPRFSSPGPTCPQLDGTRSGRFARVPPGAAAAALASYLHRMLPRGPSRAWLSELQSNKVRTVHPVTLATHRWLVAAVLGGADLEHSCHTKDCWAA